jgi:phosphate transport system substrate-binding protein
VDVAGVSSWEASLPYFRIATASAVSLLGLTVAGCSSSGHASPTNSAPVVNQLAPQYDTATATSVTLDGAGANSIQPFFSRVFYDYHHKNPRTTVNYSPAGSSVGITDIEQQTVDFGDTEIPMSTSDQTKAKGGQILQIPVDLGGVAISYNVPGVSTGLKLDGPTLAGIFDGSITKWNDPQIASVSGISNLPNIPIVAVHRADSSGPGWDLDSYLIKTSPDWVAKIGTTKASKTWPQAKVGIGQQLNTGVATYIHQTPGAIGYVEYGYALEAGFDNAALLNQSGAFVGPSIAAIAADASQATALSSSNFSIIDKPGSDSYPLANYSWTLLYQKQTDENKGLALGKLIDYVITTGQADASFLGYAPLPAAAQQLAATTLGQLETGAGTPLFAQ